jgi:putative PIG3 family NAD(P)H quinone oxidoreductase
MYAVTIREPGGPEVLEWTEVADPGQAGPGEVLVEVAATAVNRADLLQRRGFYPPPAGASPYLGLECSGRVLAVGSGVTRCQAGDEVAALLAGGGYAEQVLVPAGQLMPLPAGVDLVTAAALPEVTATVWSNLFMLASLHEGETLLVHGGGSGIGTCATQLAKAAGVRVIVTAGSAAKLQRCAELGADVGINYREESFAERVLEVTGGAGADVILDNMGAAYLEPNVRALATSGRIVVIGMQGGTKGELDLGRLMGKRGAILATSLRARPVDEKAAIVRSVVEHVWPQVAAGTLRPVVDRVLPITDVVQAHQVVEDGDNVGKVLMTVPSRTTQAG